ncbi:MAG: hypothetical protein V3T58_02345 [Candidatus Hydrothermarchaeales archaeon]
MVGSWGLDLNNVIAFLTGGGVFELLRRFGPRILERFLKKREEKSLAHGDLRASIQTFCDLWEDYRGIDIPGHNFREDLRVSLQGIREQARAYEQFLEAHIITTLRSLSQEFFALLEKDPDADDKAWSNLIEHDGNKICGEFRSLVKEHLK